MTDEQTREFLQGVLTQAHPKQLNIITGEHAVVNYNDYGDSKNNMTKTEKEACQAVKKLMDAKDEKGDYIMQDQEQWWAIKQVLTQLCGFPQKKSAWEKTLDNLELLDLRIPYIYESARKVHPHNLPTNVELWHQFKNTADNYSYKQVMVAATLMEYLKK